MRHRLSNYCWEKAADYEKRVSEEKDPDLEALFVALRNAWINAANRAVIVEAWSLRSRMVSEPRLLVMEDGRENKLLN